MEIKEPPSSLGTSGQVDLQNFQPQCPWCCCIYDQGGPQGVISWGGEDLLPIQTLEVEQGLYRRVTQEVDREHPN